MYDVNFALGGTRAFFDYVPGGNARIGLVGGGQTSSGGIDFVVPNSSTSFSIPMTLGTSGNLSIQPNVNTTVPLTIKGAASQTGDLQQWQNSSGTVLTRINATGGVELNGKDIELMTLMGAY